MRNETKGKNRAEENNIGNLFDLTGLSAYFSDTFFFANETLIVLPAIAYQHVTFMCVPQSEVFSLYLSEHLPQLHWNWAQYVNGT